MQRVEEVAQENQDSNEEILKQGWKCIQKAEAKTKRYPRCNGDPLSGILIKRRDAVDWMRPTAQTDSRPHPECWKARTL